jgi:putative flippase GtrA
MIKEIIKLLRDFISYFAVGGIAAIVEWVCFFVTNSILLINPFLSTFIAFIFSTFVNWILGRKMTFRTKSLNRKRINDMIAVYIVSAIGLLWNLMLMYILVYIMRVYPMLSKILATGIVFLWNFVIRRFFLYKK